ncbi:hypothetical protein DW775_07285 [Agathobacter rectalis]|uniref:Uncharacterized protein n=1 Tax=Agathobacter rectalis TaxID=39491 RepID=A0A414HZ45_9FIRM|nr:hypothetical protein DW775_07285 [Agathobacter rectalis]
MAKSLIDIVKEQQAKLGYRKEIVRLYYPLSTLRHFFECAGADNKIATGMISEQQMLEILAPNNLPKQLTDTIGEIKVTTKNERFCIEIPPEGSEYVHENTADNEFISELIALVGTHGCTMEQITELFYKYSDNIEKKEMQNGEFDCYIRFLNDPDDTYYYCFHDEGCHIIYHRFLPQDYADFGF